MDELLNYFINTFNSFLREINVISEEIVSSVRPVLQDSKDLVISLYPKAIINSLLHSIRVHLNIIYTRISDISDQNSFYIPLVISSFRQFTKPIRTWNSSHLLTGILGFFVGSCITALLNRYVFLKTKYIAPMRAVVAKNDRGIQGITYIEEALVPMITHRNDVLIRVKAASIDIIDVEIACGRGKILRKLFRNTILKEKDHSPFILGRDCTGVVVDTGYNVSKFEIGDEVWLAVPYWMTGTIADYVSVEECYVSHKPERLGFLDAASLPYSGCIALDCVKKRAGISSMQAAKGKKVLVHFGHTATGYIIIQLCSMYRISITTSCISQAVNKMLDAGVHDIILLEQLNQNVFQKRKYDIVFNTIGDPGQEFCYQCVKECGIVIDASSQYYVPSDVHNFIFSKIYVMWLRLFQIFGFNIWKDVPISSNVLDELGELVNEGQLYPITDSVSKIRNCDRAFWTLGSTKIIGKPVIYMNSPGNNEFYK